MTPLDLAADLDPWLFPITMVVLVAVLVLLWLGIRRHLKRIDAFERRRDAQ